MNDERLDLELGELFHAAADVEMPDALATRVASIPGSRPARRGVGRLLFGPGSAPNRPVGAPLRTRTSIPIGSVIVAGLVLVGLIVVVPRVAPTAFSPASLCTLRPAATTAAPPANGPTPTQVPAPPTPTGPPKPTPTAAPGAFHEVGSMTTARFGASATLLKDGRVLIIGGEGNGDGGPLASAELYDPASCTFSSTGSMPAPGSGVATLLKDGRVLITGGFDGSAGGLASALLFDPATGSFSPTGAMTMARGGHSALLLEDGRVLIAGGRADPSGDPKFLASAELYDPVAGTFTATGSMLTAQDVSATAPLPNGRVLFIMGGQGLNDGPASAQLYDPATGTFSPTGSMLAGWAGSATVLQDGRVLVLGEIRNLPIGVMPIALPSAELYDPKTATFAMTGTYAGPADSAILLPNGHVLVLGAVPSGVVSHGVSGAKSQLYDPKAGTFAPTGSMTIARVGPTVTLLQEGRILVAGGDGQHEYLSSAELFVP